LQVRQHHPVQIALFTFSDENISASKKANLATVSSATYAASVPPKREQNQLMAFHNFAPFQHLMLFHYMLFPIGF